MSSASFPQTFSPNLLEKLFCHSEHFVEKEKGAWSGEYGRWDRIDQPTSNVFLAWFLHNNGKVRFSYWRVLSVFFRFSCTCCSSWESALSVWLWFKNSNWIILWWSDHTHSIAFLPWSSTIRVDSGDSSLSSCLQYWTLSEKTHFSSPEMIFLKNRSFLRLERRLVTLDV